MKNTLVDLGLFDELLLAITKQFSPPIPPTGLESEEIAEQRRLLKLKEAINYAVGEIEEGYRYFLEHGSPSCKEKLSQLDKGEAAMSLMEAASEESHTHYKALGLDEAELGSLYEMACKFQYDQPDLAQKLFACLIFFDFYRVAFWLGLAFTQLQKPEVARKIYEMTLIIGGDDPLPYLYFAKFLKLQNDPLAEVAIEEGIKRASENQEILNELNALK